MTKTRVTGRNVDIFPEVDDIKVQIDSKEYYVDRILWENKEEYIDCTLYQEPYEVAYAESSDSELTDNSIIVTNKLPKPLQSIEVEGRTEYIETENVTGFFSNGYDSNYWYDLADEFKLTEPLGDGWVRFSGSNPSDSSATSLSLAFCPTVDFEFNENAEYYTLMVEIRNCSYTGRVGIRQSTATSSIWDGSNNYTDITGDGVYRIPFPVKYPSNAARNVVNSIYFFAKNTSLTCDMRVSLYEGNYEGNYQPPNMDLLTDKEIGVANTYLDKYEWEFGTFDVSESSPNLTPYFSHDCSDKYNRTTNPGGYWGFCNPDFIEELEDGWAKISFLNDPLHVYRFASFYVQKGNSFVNVINNQKYTFLFEWRNSTLTDNKWDVNLSSNQTDLSGTFPYFKGVSGERRIVLTGQDKITSRYFTSLDISAETISDASIQILGTVEVRASLYEGEYLGPYKPFVKVEKLQTFNGSRKSLEKYNLNSIRTKNLIRVNSGDYYRFTLTNRSNYYNDITVIGHSYNDSEWTILLRSKNGTVEIPENIQYISVALGFKPETSQLSPVQNVHALLCNDAGLKIERMLPDGRFVNIASPNIVSTTRNLVPYFSNYSKTKNSYWIDDLHPNFKPLLKGWAHFNCDNSENNLTNEINISTCAQPFVKSVPYTMLVEIKNFAINGENTDNVVMYVSHEDVGQLRCQNNIQSMGTEPLTIDGNGTYKVLLAGGNNCSRSYCLSKHTFIVPSETNVEFDIRISLYESDYSAPLEFLMEDGYLAANDSIGRQDNILLEKTSEYISIDDKWLMYQILTDVPSYISSTVEPWIGYRFYDEDKSPLNTRCAAKYPVSTLSAMCNILEIPEGAQYLRVSYRSYGEGTISVRGVNHYSGAYIPYKQEIQKLATSSDLIDSLQGEILPVNNLVNMDNCIDDMEEIEKYFPGISDEVETGLMTQPIPINYEEDDIRKREITRPFAVGSMAPILVLYLWFLRAALTSQEGWTDSDTVQWFGENAPFYFPPGDTMRLYFSILNSYVYPQTTINLTEQGAIKDDKLKLHITVNGQKYDMLNTPITVSCGPEEEYDGNGTYNCYISFRGLSCIYSVDYNRDGDSIIELSDSLSITTPSHQTYQQGELYAYLGDQYFKQLGNYTLGWNFENDEILQDQPLGFAVLNKNKDLTTNVSGISSIWWTQNIPEKAGFTPINSKGIIDDEFGLVRDNAKYLVVLGPKLDESSYAKMLIAKGYVSNYVPYGEVGSVVRSENISPFFSEPYANTMYWIDFKSVPKRTKVVQDTTNGVLHYNIASESSIKLSANFKVVSTNEITLDNSYTLLCEIIGVHGTMEGDIEVELSDNNNAFEIDESIWSIYSPWENREVPEFEPYEPYEWPEESTLFDIPIGLIDKEDSSKFLSGGVLCITTSDGEVVDRWDTENAYYVASLSEGNYNLLELLTPLGYQEPDETEWNFIVNADGTINFNGQDYATDIIIQNEVKIFNLEHRFVFQTSKYNVDLQNLRNLLLTFNLILTENLSSFDLRLSLYEGNYNGEYVPYSQEVYSVPIQTHLATLPNSEIKDKLTISDSGNVYMHRNTNFTEIPTEYSIVRKDPQLITSSYIPHGQTITGYFKEPFTNNIYDYNTNPNGYWIDAPYFNAIFSDDIEGLHAIFDSQSSDTTGTVWPDFTNSPYDFDSNDGWAHVIMDSRASAGNKNKNNYIYIQVGWNKLNVVEGRKYCFVIDYVDNGTLTNASKKLVIQPTIGNSYYDRLTQAKGVEISPYISVLVAPQDIIRNKLSKVVSFDDFTRLHGSKDTRGYLYILPECYYDFFIRISLLDCTDIYEELTSEEYNFDIIEMPVLGEGGRIEVSSAPISGKLKVGYLDTDPEEEEV